MTFASQAKDNLLEIISEMTMHVEDFVIDPTRDFSRCKKLPFATMLQLLISMGTGTMRSELLRYFSYSAETATNSAFVQQRAKLSNNVMPYILKKFNEKYSSYSLYKGKYQLLAVDGSTFTFTRNSKDSDTYFEPNFKSTYGFNQVHLVPSFDLLSKRYLDCIIQPIRKKNEFNALCQLIDSHQRVEGTIPIFIADRGFHALNVFAHAIENNAYFLIRATDVKTNRLLDHDAPNTDCYDIWIHRILSRSQSKSKHLHPDSEHLYKYICADVTFDYINDIDKEYEINLRIIRLKLPNGNYENIITNLPGNYFTTEDIQHIYNLRWGIETSFRELKHDIGAQNFHAKSIAGIEMELWARLILYNFCSIITQNVVFKQCSKKHEYQVNYSVAIKACTYYLRLRNCDKPPDIESLISKNLLPIRPNRNYAHNHRFQIPVSFTYRFA